MQLMTIIIKTIIHIYVLSSSESAVLVMQPKWKEVITQRKSEFIKTLKQITRTMRRQQFVDEVKMCTNFINILKDPWNHKYISCIMRIFYPSYEDSNNINKK